MFSAVQHVQFDVDEHEAVFGVFENDRTIMYHAKISVFVLSNERATSACLCVCWNLVWIRLPSASICTTNDSWHKFCLLS